MFPTNVPVIAVVVLQGGKPARKFRLANSRHDLARFPRDEQGQPIIGPNVYRERTKKELRAEGLVGKPYLETLVPLCNVPQLV